MKWRLIEGVVSSSPKGTWNWLLRALCTLFALFRLIFSSTFAHHCGWFISFTSLHIFSSSSAAPASTYSHNVKSILLLFDFARFYFDFLKQSLRSQLEFSQSSQIPWFTLSVLDSWITFYLLVSRCGIYLTICLSVSCHHKSVGTQLAVVLWVLSFAPTQPIWASLRKMWARVGPQTTGSDVRVLFTRLSFQLDAPKS